MSSWPCSPKPVVSTPHYRWLHRFWFSGKILRVSFNGAISHPPYTLWRKLRAEEWCFWTVVLEKALESPLDCKEIQPVHPKGDEGLFYQSWGFFGRNDAKAETPVLWPPPAKSWFIGKDSDAGRDWGQEKKTTEDEMAGWHHWLDGCESEWTPGVGDGQGGLAYCDSWGHKQSDTTERQLNWKLVEVMEFQLSYFKSWKMMLWKCCTQYAS